MGSGKLLTFVQNSNSRSTSNGKWEVGKWEVVDVRIKFKVNDLWEVVDVRIELKVNELVRSVVCLKDTVVV